MNEQELKEAIDSGVEWWCYARYAFAANPAKHYLGMAVGDRIRCLPRENGWWPAIAMMRRWRISLTATVNSSSSARQ